MPSSAEDVDNGILFTEQVLLAGSLEELGRKLQTLRNVDPVMAMDTAMSALATIRVWLRADQMTGVIHAGAVSEEQLERWEHHLAANLGYLSTLAEAVAGEVNMTLQDRNRLEG